MNLVVYFINQLWLQGYTHVAYIIKQWQSYFMVVILFIICPLDLWWWEYLDSWLSVRFLALYSRSMDYFSHYFVEKKLDQQLFVQTNNNEKRPLF